MGVLFSAQTQFLYFTLTHDSPKSQIECLKKNHVFNCSVCCNQNQNNLFQLHYLEMCIAPFVCVFVYLSRCILQLSLCPQFISLHAFTALLYLFFLFLQTVDLL